jgi:hypothetical protein
MATLRIVPTPSLIPTIGETAGRVWHTLDEEGQLRLTTLQRQIEVPSMLLHLALGWLAREDKIEITGDGKSYQVRLR